VATDVLERLENKIRHILQEVETLREENRRLATELRASESGSGNGGKAVGSVLEEELRTLQGERTDVRSRIEGLITRMEAAE
jgi:FtsZ-binding cell division protein ZapB